MRLTASFALSATQIVPSSTAMPRSAPPASIDSPLGSAVAASSTVIVPSLLDT
jgi:hypothetical protein